MKVIGLIAAGVLILFAGTGNAYMPGIEPALKLESGGSVIKLSYDTNATVVDWNNDGLKDLLVGEFTQGYITLYVNQGTDINPVFNSGAKVQSNGSPITVTYG
ncbi:MAG: hypothetical protein ACYTG7_01420 [Planctomycetota bacterium]|jgi:hypothetical protein